MLFSFIWVAVHYQRMILQCYYCSIPLWHQVNGSILPSAVISLYCMYLCYNGLASEPRDYECNGLHAHSKAVSTGTLTLGLVTTVLQWSTLLSGLDLLQLFSPHLVHLVQVNSPWLISMFLMSMFSCLLHISVFAAWNFILKFVVWIRFLFSSPSLSLSHLWLSFRIIWVFQLNGRVWGLYFSTIFKLYSDES